MSAATETDEIAHLDFDHVPPCEHSQHRTHHADEPATYVVKFQCLACSYNGEFLLCQFGWQKRARLRADRAVTEPSVTACGSFCGRSGERIRTAY